MSRGRDAGYEWLHRYSSSLQRHHSCEMLLMVLGVATGWHTRCRAAHLQQRTYCLLLDSVWNQGPVWNQLDFIQKHQEKACRGEGVDSCKRR